MTKSIESGSVKEKVSHHALKSNNPSADPIDDLAVYINAGTVHSELDMVAVTGGTVEKPAVYGYYLEPGHVNLTDHTVTIRAGSYSLVWVCRGPVGSKLHFTLVNAAGHVLADVQATSDGYRPTVVIA